MLFPFRYDSYSLNVCDRDRYCGKLATALELSIHSKPIHFSGPLRLLSSSPLSFCFPIYLFVITSDVLRFLLSIFMTCTARWCRENMGGHGDGNERLHGNTFFCGRMQIKKYDILCLRGRTMTQGCDILLAYYVCHPQPGDLRAASSS